MLLIDTPPGSPRRSREQVEEEDLLLDLNYQDYSTSDNTLTFTPQPPKLQGETWSSTIHWNQSTFFCEEDSEED